MGLQCYCSTTTAEKIIGFIIVAMNNIIPVVSHVNKGHWNADLFKGRELANVTLINTSRGGLINEKALFMFLKTNKKATVFLDVLETEPIAMDFYLNKLNNVFITPHIGWNSVESIELLKYWLFDELMKAYNHLTNS